MIRWVALLLLLLGPGVLRAETIRVRAGEHEGFSRLVLEFPAAPQWAFGRVDGGYEFRPTPGEINYDLAEVFRLIPRARIAALEDRGQGRLFLAVSCACHADAFDLRQGRVVLDIKDGVPAGADAPFEARLPDLRPVAASDPPRTGTTSLERARAGLPLFPPGPVASPSPVAQLPEESPVARDILQDDPPQERVLAIETALLEQIARATAQGLLDPNLEAVQIRREEMAPPAPDQPVEAEPPPLPTPATPQGHVAIETSVDRAAAAEPQILRTDTGADCLPPEYFDVAAWGDPIDHGAQIATYRTDLVGEFDIPDAVALTRLARYYVYLTFGAEAKALLRQFPDAIERADLLAVLADVVDRGHSDVAPALAAQMVCDSPAALWSILVQPELRRGQSINAPAAILAFTTLPAHLREYLGPGLVARFLEIGDVDSADAIRAAVGRGALAPSGDLSLLDARMDLAMGDLGDATTSLDEAISQADGALPDALLTRVDSALAAGQSVPPDLIALLSSLAFERRGTDLGQQLKAAEIRARAALPDFDAAFAELDRAQRDGTLAPGTLETLWSDVFGQIAERGADASFLQMVVPRLAQAQSLAPEKRRALAARFLSMSLPGPARQLLFGDGAPPVPEDRLLYARAALQENNPDVAVSYLAGIDGPEAKSLRAQAFDLAGDHPAAMQLYGELGDAQGQQRAAWLGGLWPAVEAIDPGAEGAAARLMAAPPAALPETPIAQSRALVEASREVRATLDRLLQDVPPPGADAGS